MKTTMKVIYTVFFCTIGCTFIDVLFKVQKALEFINVDSLNIFSSIMLYLGAFSFGIIIGHVIWSKNK